MKKCLPILFLIAITCLKINVIAQVNYIRKSPKDSLAIIKNSFTTISFVTKAINSKISDKRALEGLYLVRGEAEINVRRFANAVKDLSLAIALNSRSVNAYFNRGLAYQRMGDYQHSVDDYAMTLSFGQGGKDQMTMLYDNIAIDERYLKHFDRAIEADSMSLSITPQFVTAYENRAAAYAMKGKYQLAINDLSSTMFGYQNNPRALSYLFFKRADLKRSLKNYKDAINDDSYAIKLDPENKFAYWGRASCYYVDGDFELADADYSKAILFFKGDNRSLAMLHDDRAVMEMGQQQFGKAVADDSLAIGLNPQFAPAYFNKANAHAQNADYRLSNADFMKTITFYQNNKRAMAQIYDSMAHNEYFLNEYQQDVDDCDAAIKLNDQNWDPYLERGRAYLKLSKKEPAMNDFKQVLAMDSTKNSSDYAFALFYTGEQDKAVKIMQDSFLATTNAYALMANYYNMACLLSLMNKPDEANAYLKKCIDGGYPKKYALTDGDLDNIRSTSDFKSTIESSTK